MDGPSDPAARDARTALWPATPEIDDAVARGGILALEVEIGLSCGGACEYCRPELAGPTPERLSHRDLERVLAEARALGARQVSFVEGDWLGYPHLAELLAEVDRLQLGLEVRLGSRALEHELAERLVASRARIVVDVHGVRDETHDRVARHPGSAGRARRTIEELRRRDPGHSSIAVRARICRANRDEIEPLWRWVRSLGLEPWFENAPPGRDDAPPELDDALAGLDARALEGLFRRLAEVDRAEFGHEWDPQPPWPGLRDLRHRYACAVSVSGVVRPAGLLPLPMGDLREHGLDHVLRESEVMENLRAHATSLKGPCRDCEKLPTCAGSRAVAFALTGDYLASDPTCWRNADRASEIARLPLALSEHLPQKAPMRFVDALDSVGDRVGECSVTIRDDLPMAGANVVDDVAYLEMIAQSMAALEVFAHLGTGDGGFGGFLVGAEDLEVFAPARLGDRLRIRVRKDVRIGKYGIVSGTVLRDESVLARGNIKIWRESGVPEP
ncbi:MAG: radical SAM protein [Deltaproteobacteria bacterium]|nr:radical SAM protein [Deltaproteobacteria bacterium]